MVLHLRVHSGPEAGKTASFEAPVVTIGRGAQNDLVLPDGRVSLVHGELILRDRGYVYRDLKSRHGSVVVTDEKTFTLKDDITPQEAPVYSGTRLVLGDTALEVDIEVTGPEAEWDDSYTQSPGPTSGEEPHDGQREHILARAYDSLDAVTRRLSSQDPRLVGIFKLSRNLNAATDLREILDLVVESTFEAFPAANFFAITLLPQSADTDDIHSLTPWITRARRQGKSAQVAPLLSTSLLEQVAKTRESVLFVRDHTDQEITQSIINARITACLAAPLVGQRNLIGVMQADTRGLGGLFGPEDLDLFTVMASYAAFGIERARLNTSILEMFEGIARASTKAIDARDPSTAGHSERVARLSVALARAVNQTDEGSLADLHFTNAELLELRYAALLHDFGKIGVRESILTKDERLYSLQREMLVERFRSIKGHLAAHLYSRECQTLAERAEAPSYEQLESLKRHVEQIEHKLDAQLEYILSQQTHEHIPAETVARFREIGQQTFCDLAGREYAYVPPRELTSLCIPDGTLTPMEWADMMSHARCSREYLEQIPWSPELARIPTIAASHHEKLNGTGYPEQLAGEEILPQTRILTICDVFDALTAIDRPYRRAMDTNQALQVIGQEAEAGLIDTVLLQIFIDKVLPQVTEGPENA